MSDQVVITTPGSGVWEPGFPSDKEVTVEVWSSGGGGGASTYFASNWNAGGGGGGGGYVKKTFTLPAGYVVPYSLGAGGAGGGLNSFGGNAGDAIIYNPREESGSNSEMLVISGGGGGSSYRNNEVSESYDAPGGALVSGNADVAHDGGFGLGVKYSDGGGGGGGANETRNGMPQTEDDITGDRTDGAASPPGGAGGDGGEYWADDGTENGHDGSTYGGGGGGGAQSWNGGTGGDGADGAIIFSWEAATSVSIPSALVASASIIPLSEIQRSVAVHPSPLEMGVSVQEPGKSVQAHIPSPLVATSSPLSPGFGRDVYVAPVAASCSVCTPDRIARGWTVMVDPLTSIASIIAPEAAFYEDTLFFAAPLSASATLPPLSKQVEAQVGRLEASATAKSPKTSLSLLAEVLEATTDLHPVTKQVIFSAEESALSLTVALLSPDLENDRIPIIHRHFVDGAFSLRVAKEGSCELRKSAEGIRNFRVPKEGAFALRAKVDGLLIKRDAE